MHCPSGIRLIIIYFKISAHRHIGETNMNLHSSRSHTIFRMVTLSSLYSYFRTYLVLHDSLTYSFILVDN